MNIHSGFVLPTGNAIQTSLVAGNTALFQAYDVDNTTYRTLITMTANNSVTLDLAFLNSISAVANIDIGAFDLRALTLTADVADGTMPLNITSTTLVTNLNAEHWNSKHLGSLTDGKLVRYNSTGTQMETGIVTESAGALSLITTLGMGGDLTNYENTNDGSPEFRLGSADAEELHIQSVYDAGAKTLDYVLFQTDVASATADKGQFKFNVDGTEILRVDDGGLEVVGTVMATLGFMPDANDGASLGTAALSFSDLFLAEGAVINFDNGDLTLTQAGKVLTLAGSEVITVANTNNVVGLTINQNDTTNNLRGLDITNTGTGNCLFLNQDGNGISLNIDSEAQTSECLYINTATTSGNGTTGVGGAYIISSTVTSAMLLNVLAANTSGFTGTTHGMVKFEVRDADSTGHDLVILNGGTGNGIFINQDANGLALNIDKDCTVNDTRTWAVAIASDNAGTGTALGCGIDMSSFSVDEPIIKAVADAITTAGTLTGQIAIDIGGTTYYLYYYTTGS